MQAQEKKVIKFRTVYTSESDKKYGKWTDWVDDEEGKGILVVRDMDKNVVSTYGEKEKKFSVLTVRKMKDHEDYNAYEYDSVDEENARCRVILLYAKDETLNYNYLVIEYAYKRIRFAIERE